MYPSTHDPHENLQKVSVSLIIINYKQKYYLTNLLRYLKNFNYAEAEEVIVVDNNSLTINEQRILLHEHPNVKFLFLTENFGPSVARNIGVKHSNSTYIQFLDADDWIDPSKLSKQGQHAKNNNYPSFVCSNWARVTSESSPENKTVISYFKPQIKLPLPVFLIASDNFIPLMSGIILKKAFEEEGGFNEKMWFVEDVNLSIRLALNGHYFLFLDTEAPLFFYRTNVINSLSNSNGIEFNRACFKNYKLIFNYVQYEYKDAKSIVKYKNLTFDVIWNIYIQAVLTDDCSLIEESVNFLKQHKKIDNPKKYGKKFIAARILGYKIFTSFYIIYKKLIRNKKK